MNSILLSMIHDKATANPPKVEITADNYKVWVEHWFKTAYALAGDFERQNLPETAKAIYELIAENKRYAR